MVGGVRECRGRVDVVTGKGCSRFFLDFSSSFKGVPSFTLEPLSPASSASAISDSRGKMANSNAPFSGLVICVTGLTKETGKQVKEATERLGGQYSPHLHPQCTHLVVQSFHGRKFEHALKHGPKNGLLLVTIGWFVDSVKRNARSDETLYSVNRTGDDGILNGDFKQFDQSSGAENSCLLNGLAKHATQPDMIEAKRETKRQTVYSSPSGQCFYVDADVSPELRCKVVEALSAEGASLLNQWFVGCNATHIVCEGPSMHKYLGHSSNLVTPLWALTSAKERSLQRLVHLSVDLARYTGGMLNAYHHGVLKKEVNMITSSGNIPSSVIKISHEERKKKVNQAKDGVRKRRDLQMQTFQTPVHPTTPVSLLDSICWSISEPTSTASRYMESSSVENPIGDQTSKFFDAKKDVKESESSFVNLTRPLIECEKSELIFKSHFLTIIFPVDQFLEMGPSSRTFFSSKGFTCLPVLEYIYEFYQENMSAEEIEIAIQTDSRHTDQLRAAYSSRETAERGQVEFKRIDFLGSRKNFEMLKRVSSDNYKNTYELLITAGVPYISLWKSATLSWENRNHSTLVKACCSNEGYLLFIPHQI